MLERERSVERLHGRIFNNNKLLLLLPLLRLPSRMAW